MLLHKTPLLDMHYDYRNHVLRVVWPDIPEAQDAEIQGSIEKLRTMIKGFYISKILVDARYTTHLLPLETLLKVWHQVTELGHELGVQKVARIRSEHPDRETLAQEAYLRFQPESKYPELEYRQFDTEAEAMLWLRSDLWPQSS